MNNETVCVCGNQKAFDEQLCPECQDKPERVDRKFFIGGSDIASVLGISRWKTPLQIYCEKAGLVQPDDLSGNEAVELGTELEDFVAKKFERVTQLKVRRAPKRYVHKDHPFLACQVDRLVTNSDWLLEVKTCSAWKRKEWEGEEIPQEYIAQVLWQLGITGRSVGYIAVLIGGQSFRWKKIDFDKDLFDQMVTKAVLFWKMVQDRTPPIATEDDREILLKLYPEEKTDDMVQAFQEMETEIARLQEIKSHIDELSDQKAEIENKIKQVIGENVGIITDKYSVTWKKQNTAPKVMFDLLKADHLYERYTQPNQTRVLRVALNKEANNVKRS